MTKGSKANDVWLGLLDHVWPVFFDGCSLTRPTDEWLTGAGEWESIELGAEEGQGRYDTIPRVVGKLIKKR